VTGPTKRPATVAKNIGAGRRDMLDARAKKFIDEAGDSVRVADEPFKITRKV
jgi:hypothetical protein